MYIAAAKSSNIPTTSEIITALPVDYRPSRNVIGNFIQLTAGGGVVISYVFTVRTTGNITVSTNDIGAAANTRAFIGMTSYETV